MPEGRLTPDHAGPHEQPHIADRRISVRQVDVFVEERGEAPGAVADRYDLDVADVYHVLAYYHDHPLEMRAEDRLGVKPRGIRPDLLVGAERDEAIVSFRVLIDRPERGSPDPS